MLFADICGYDEVWILGDRFVNKTSFNYFLDQSHTAIHVSSENFMLQHYEVKVFSGYKNKDKNPSYLARMSNQLTHAITERKLLPKAIVVVMEDDLIVNLNSFTNDAGISDLFKGTTTWLVSAFAETISEYHKLLPPKAKKEDYTKLCGLQPCIMIVSSTIISGRSSITCFIRQFRHRTRSRSIPSNSKDSGTQKTFVSLTKGN